MERRRENNGWLSVPQFGAWDQKGGASPNYSMVFGQARENRKQVKKDVKHLSLGHEADLIARQTHRVPRHHHDHHHDDSIMNNRRMTVPEFGVWDQKGQVRANRKQVKKESKHLSLSRDTDLIAQQTQHVARYQYDYHQDDSSVKKKKFLTYINCCIRPY